MKFLTFALLVASVSARLSALQSFRTSGTTSDTGSGNYETLISSNGDLHYDHKFIVYGHIYASCFDASTFCNTAIGEGSFTSFVSCWAAQQAESYIESHYAMAGQLKVHKKAKSTQDVIQLSTVIDSALLASTYSGVSSETSADSYNLADLNVWANADTGLASAVAEATSAAQVYTLAEASTGATDETVAQVESIVGIGDMTLTGKTITNFEALVHATSYGFTTSETKSESSAYVDAAAAAYVQAVAQARNLFATYTDLDDQAWEDVTKFAEAFGTAYAKSRAFLALSLTVRARVTHDTVNSIMTFSLVPDVKDVGPTVLCTNEHKPAAPAAIRK